MHDAKNGNTAGECVDIVDRSVKYQLWKFATCRQTYRSVENNSA